ncbi:predicted secreted Zn-dependent protease [Rhizobium subbaraonis]|uniref:Predicted secreted Zn-dependent protease n=1 Tax=Rhizobium subbaraonis TaxID=908946 RepID=A0A285U6E4_9HYPH|nr:predicted secreted Zn-dependent protease [Rhizobium subbaraonis]
MSLENFVNPRALSGFLAGFVLLSPMLAHADWKPVEQVKTYAVSGATGMELYRSIGEHGPKVGVGRAIAFTDFKLTWSRKYEPREGGCVLSSARPKLIITYMLPKPTPRPKGALGERWDTFLAGVRAHEKIHGDIIEDMVRQIEAYSVGLTVADDPDCRKIRKVLTQRLGELSQAQRQRSRDFDRAELSNGGNIHQLILDLVGDG